MGLLNNVIRTAVISALGAKLAKGRSPIVGALIALLATRMLSKADDSKQEKAEDSKQEAAPSQEGLGGLIDQFKRGGLDEIIQSWIGTGQNKAITPNQLHSALGPETVDSLAKDSGLPREDPLSQLARLLLDESIILPRRANCLREKSCYRAQMTNFRGTLRVEDEPSLRNRNQIGRLAFARLN